VTVSHENDFSNDHDQAGEARLLPENIYEILRRTFGFESFRGMQERVIDRILSAEHTLALMPTGAGKSLCYQIPALAREGTTIVVSPLIALMHDQIRSAKAVGIRAASMTSADMDKAETAERLRAGDLDLLYVAPERATTQGFQSLLSVADISLFAIDEAHCVSEWGHDFRPDYRGLRPMLDEFAYVPRLALTATADEVTRADILKQLGIPHEGLIKAGFDRPNIRYAISARDNGAKQISDFVARTEGAQPQGDRGFGRKACRDGALCRSLSRRAGARTTRRNPSRFCGVGRYGDGRHHRLWHGD